MVIVDGYILAAAACVLLALLVVVVAWQWQQHETKRLKGFKEWLEEGRLP